MNKSDLQKNLYMLEGTLGKSGYDWWWHSFTGYDKKTKEKKSFFIEYFIINPQLNNKSIVLGQNEKNKIENKKPSYMMIKVGVWGENAKQLHNFYPLSKVEIQKNKLEILVENNFLSENRIYGEVLVTEEEVKNKPEIMCDCGKMTWDLKVNKKISFNVGYGTSEFFRNLGAFEMFWHAEGMKTEYSGTVTLDEVEYEIIAEKSFGYADKNWGKNFTSPWIWLSSCNMISKISGKKLENSVINIGGGKPKIFGIPIKNKILINFFYEGKDYEFNFSKFWIYSRTKFKCYETGTQVLWEIRTENKEVILELKSSCEKKDMLKINYESPDGMKRHNNLWNGGTGVGVLKIFDKKDRVLIDEIILENIGCEFGEYDK